jgi:cell division protein ZipA
MTALRWILLVAGLALIAAIYVIGRRNRRTSAMDAPQRTRESAVPQLDQPVRIRERADPPLTISSRDSEAADDGMMDDLPPMHASDPTSTTSMHSNAPLNTSAHTPMATSYQPIFSEPQPSMTTGAFIAAQAREPVTRKLYEQNNDKVADPTVVVAKPSESTLTAARTAEPAPTPTYQLTEKPLRKPVTRKIVALRLAAGSERVDGTRLKSLFDAAGLRHGKYSIFHRLHTDESPLFSVASMVEPGTFDLHAMTSEQFPGVTIFTQLPGPIDGTEMLMQMLTCARELEQGIGGLLQDERGLPLTEQRAQRLRDEVADFTHLLGQR